MEQARGHLDCGDGILVGFLFTREEFNALVQLRFRDTHFSGSFLDCVFDTTNGHVGAFEDLMKSVIADKVKNPFIFVSTNTDSNLVISSTGGVSMTDIPRPSTDGPRIWPWSPTGGYLT